MVTYNNTLNYVDSTKKDTLLQKISQENIMQRYFNLPIEMGKSYINPYRKDKLDKSPSCKFYYTLSNIFSFNDFAMTEYSGDCFKMAKNFYEHKDGKIYNFFQILLMIEKDFGLNTTNLKLITSVNENQPVVKNKKFKIKITPSIRLAHTIMERNYLIELLGSQYYEKVKTTIQTSYFVKFEYFDDVTKVYEKILRYDVDNPIFVFQYTTGYYHIYLPFNKNVDKKGNVIKHRKNITFDMWYDNKVKNDDNIVVITKSPKDVEVWGSYGFRAICPASENVCVIPEKILTEFKYKTFLLNYDPDVTGYKSMSKIIDKYNNEIDINYMLFPEKEKDISGYTKLNGRPNTLKYIVNAAAGLSQ